MRNLFKCELRRVGTGEKEGGEKIKIKPVNQSYMKNLEIVDVGILDINTFELFV